MLQTIQIVLLLCGLSSKCYCEKILAVFPSPFHSHQSVFRSLIQELVKRGHEVIVITTDPATTDNSPANLTEIDIHDVSYKFKNSFAVKVTGKIDDIYDQVDKFYDMFSELFEVQINTVEIQNFMKDKDQKFDLIFTEACVRPALVFSYLFKAPVITISSLGSVPLFTEYLGIPTHPILYPSGLHQRLNKRLNKLTLWEKAVEIYKHYLFERMLWTKEENENEMLKRNFGDDVPPLSELKKNVAMLMINVHQIWEGNRPVPPNVVYLGGLHLEMNDSKNISTELKSYLDNSTHGVIYMSLGSLVVPSRLNNIKKVVRAFSELQYDVLLKWDKDYLAECPKNVKIVKWVPQKEILYHPNIKLFITQGGMQSTDEAIAAGVPVIGIPILGDQWYNVEKYLDLKIGLRVDLETVTQETFVNAIITIIEDKSYKHNIKALQRMIYDKPQSSLELAVWWTEYILRHGKSPQLMAPAAHMSGWDYFEIDLLLVFMSCVAVLLFAVVYVGLKTFKILSNQGFKVKLKLL